MILTGETEVLGEETVPVPLWPTQIPHVLALKLIIYVVVL